MRIALLQLNQTIGDIDGNTAALSKAVKKAAALGADLCLAPELAVTGYPPRDLLFNRDFVNRAISALDGLALDLADAPPLVAGTPAPNDTGAGKPLFNCAALVRGGRVEALFKKTLLPSYDVFDEDRYFESGDGPGFFQAGGATMAVTVCEDLWNDSTFWDRRLYRTDPVDVIQAHGADAVLNLSASPFTLGKQAVRENMLSSTAARLKAPILYANQVGGNDDLVFAGRSMAFAPDGILFARAKGFAEDLIVADIGSMSGPVCHDDFKAESEACRALVLGIRDYVQKCGFSRVLLGLSGGVDSALTAALACRALGPENVVGVLMPSPYSSKGSVDDSLSLADNLGMKTLTLPIEPVMAAYDDALAGTCDCGPGVAEENIQSRIRGNLLMALSNKTGAMLLTTGNKSELSVGYCTIYGDMSGGLAAISDVPKTLVYAICRHINDIQGPTIPRAILDKPPSAELRPDQTDQDSLPSYDILDSILENMIVHHKSVKTIIGAGFDEATVRRVAGLVRMAEFKRHQAAPGIRITDRAFGTGWRMPIAHRWVP